MRIVADREVCAASGMCALTAPAVFDQDDVDGRVVVRNVRPAAVDLEAARQAVSLCPTGALSLDEEV
jgi:ferredoxin